MFQRASGCLSVLYWTRRSCPLGGLLWEYGDAGLLVGAIKAIWGADTQRDGGESRSQWAASFAKILWFPFFYFKDYCSKSEGEEKDDCFPCTSLL